MPAAVAAAPVIGSLLFGVAPNDTALIAVAATVMLAVAIGAGLQPAIRAARMDPLTALRAD